MKKSEIKKMPEYFDRYINLPEDISIVDALEKYGNLYFYAEQQNLQRLGDNVYAPGKWTAKDILQHIIDTERIFAYRALRISRSDKTPLPGYDENFYAEHTTAANRTIDELLQEFEVVRTGTIMLFKSFNNEMLQNEGTCSGKEMSTLALGFVIVGHLIHHIHVLRERYYPIIAS